MKLRVLSVGREKPQEFTALAVADYAARLRRVRELDFELMELKAETGPAAREREAELLLEAARKARGQAPAELWALDERGAQLSSVELAQRLGALRDRGQGLSLCIGGDEGLAPRVRGEAQRTWSLSRLTLPHRLARVLVLEQLYRAFEILRGSPYHK